ncbi:LOW QUALITY PROTEIN: hypothetical protein Cgig2_023910 [Carnegiea gigantea]|uniref:Uncharacterized protein n=1 Tax=Carnegiea gigantea TaxID=171969 RepID=A0A9Q1JI03_9CARY|nr:LOW QUALITY PROTEIN: hypothetical protein Cgig2_023910 [Carnegiea gigantea]
MVTKSRHDKGTLYTYLILSNKAKLSGLAMVMTIQDTFLPKSSKGKLPLIFTPFKMTKDKQGKDVKEVIHQYYKGLLGNQLTVRQQIDPKVIAKGNTLIVEQQVNLCTPFTDQEIKSVMFSIPNTKSPPPDGFSSGFFKTTWHITGGLGERQVTYATVVAAIYSIRRARNEKAFSNHMIHVQTQSKLAKEHIMQRTLTLNSVTGKYAKCIDKILG